MGQLHPISSGAKILVVEDEALIGEMIADALQEQGFDVFLVSNAADALRHVESGAAVDALFTDVHLPGGMDGSELASRVRSLRRTCRSSMRRAGGSQTTGSGWSRVRSSCRSPTIRATPAAC